MNIFFIIPHFSDPNFEYKKQIIDSVSKSKNINVVLGEYSSDGSFDYMESIELLLASDFYIADLSFERPSCYYELGYAQAINKPGFLIAEEGTVIHQLEGTVEFYQKECFRDILDKIVQKILVAKI